MIRRLAADDLPVVQGLLAQLAEAAHADTYQPARMAELLLEMETLPQVYLNLVCEIDGMVRGFLSVVFYRTLFHAGGTALINELVVDRSCRGRGLGRALVQAAVEAARARGMDEIEVGTENENLAAQSFYHRVGFDEEYILLGLEFPVNT
jgi:ribosomal protein S18 acetylase RimI-like enzyme